MSCKQKQTILQHLRTHSTHTPTLLLHRQPRSPRHLQWCLVAVTHSESRSAKVVDGSIGRGDAVARGTGWVIVVGTQHGSGDVVGSRVRSGGCNAQGWRVDARRPVLGDDNVVLMEDASEIGHGSPAGGAAAGVVSTGTNATGTETDELTLDAVVRTDGLGRR